MWFVFNLENREVKKLYSQEIIKIVRELREKYENTHVFETIIHTHSNVTFFCSHSSYPLESCVRIDETWRDAESYGRKNQPNQVYFCQHSQLHSGSSHRLNFFGAFVDKITTYKWPQEWSEASTTKKSRPRGSISTTESTTREKTKRAKKR
jgi:hypothetical protein